MSTMDFAKGIGIGMVAGAAVGMAIAPRKKSRKFISGKMLRAASDILNDITNSMSL